MSRRIRALALALLLAGAFAASAQPTPKSAARPLDDSHWPYVVAKGDTLIGIARSRLVAGADWRVVQRLNRVANPFRLQPGSTLLIPWDLVPGTPAAATVQHVHGQVQRLRGNAVAQALLPGDSLLGGDVLTSGAQSSASIRLADGTRLLLRPESRLQIDRLERQGGATPATAGRYTSRLQTLQGAMDAVAPPPQRLDAPGPAASAGATTWRQLQIRTPVANLGVRGTSFRVRGDLNQSFFEVLEGEVRLSRDTAGPRPAEQPLSAGQGQVATAAGLGPAATLLPAPTLTLPSATLDRPAGEALGFSWPAGDSAVRRWRAQLFDVSSAAGPSALRLDGVFEAPLAVWPDALVAGLRDGEYELRVRGIDAQGLEGLDGRLRLQLAQRPALPPAPPPPPPPVRAPGLVSLEPALFGSDGVLLRWQAPAGSAVDAVLRYRLQVAATADFNAPLHLDIETDQRSHLLPSLSGGRWHWRIRAEALSDDGRSPLAGPFSATQSFELSLPFGRFWFAPGQLRILPAPDRPPTARP
ncbi:MAG: FecR domain-containing protein [Rubrivivax sp.]|jgi:hypothetical protein